MSETRSAPLTLASFLSAYTLVFAALMGLICVWIYTMFAWMIPVLPAVWTGLPTWPPSPLFLVYVFLIILPSSRFKINHSSAPTSSTPSMLKLIQDHGENAVLTFTVHSARPNYNPLSRFCRKFLRRSQFWSSLETKTWFAIMLGWRTRLKHWHGMALLVLGCVS